MTKMTDEQIQEKAKAIAKEFAEQGTPLRPKGTREGDNDRDEIEILIIEQMFDEEINKGIHHETDGYTEEQDRVSDLIDAMDLTEWEE